MGRPVTENDGLELMLEDIKKNIRENKQFLDFLKKDQDVDLLEDEEEIVNQDSDDIVEF